MSDLHDAARDGDLPTLFRLLDAGADLEDRDEKSGYTPLMAACLSPRCGVEAVRFLLDRGADLHVCERQQEEPVSDMSFGDPELSAAVDDQLDAAGIPPEMRAIIDEIRKNPPKAPAPSVLIELAVREAKLEKIRLLLDRGARVDRSGAGRCSLLMLAAYAGRENVIDLLVEAGAPLNPVSDYGESALSVLSHRGLFPAVGRLLEAGADPAPLQWNPLFRAIALGTLAEMISLLDGGARLETKDFWERTPLLLAIHTGDTAKIALLLDRGADRSATGRCDRPPMQYPVDRDDAATMEWLIAQGFDLHQTNQFGHAPLREAVVASAADCFRLLVAHGADWRGEDGVGGELMRKATDPEIIRQLVELGGDPARLEYPTLRSWIGLETCDELPISQADFIEGRSRVFGTKNPELMQIPFWDAMVRCGWDGYQAAQQFDADSPCGHSAPVWCHRRFGTSLTTLSDGRIVQIAGEHEDSYDPDFCIYNDVIVHDGKGGFEIFGYPREGFPPTDFHSATLFGGWIYIIGSLGYREDASAGATPVFRLKLDTWEIESVPTTGPAPGWIHSHRAVLEDEAIRISHGKIVTLDSENKPVIGKQTGEWLLDLRDFSWREIVR